MGLSSAQGPSTPHRGSSADSSTNKPQKVLVVPQGKLPENPYASLPGTVSVPDGKSPVQLGSGTIVSLISKGGMAMIYEVWNPTLEVKRAVKLLRPDHTEDSAQRFETEMKISAKLHHPNIVEIYAVGKWNDLPYIEMEQIDGVTVEQLIEECGSLPVDVCTAIGIMVGRALNYAHNQKYVIYGKEYHGVIHRDLKPSNIMVTKGGVVKLMDFGIAKPTTASLVTCGNMVVGTLQYLSPEQLEGKEIDVRADVYSLGTVMYEVLTGERAFPQKQLAKLVPDKLESRFVPLEEYDIKMPRQLRLLIHQCLNQAKEKRAQNALEFLRILGRVHKDLTDDSPEQVLARFMWGSRRERVQVGMRRKRKVGPIITGAAAGVLLIGGGLYLRPRVQSLLEDGFPWGRREGIDITSSVSLTSVEDSGAGELPEDGSRREAEPQGDVPLSSAASRSAVGESGRRAEADGGAGSRTTRVSKAEAVPEAAAATSRGEREDSSAKTVEQPAVSPPAEPVSMPQPPREPPLLAQLKARYRTSDVVAVFLAEVEAESYRNAAALMKHLPREQAESDKTLIYKLRALNGVGDREGAGNLLAGADVNDGEFYLAKAEHLFGTGDLDGAESLLDRAGRSQVRYMAQQAFRPRLLYVLALCASARFDQQPGMERKKSAMAAWYSLKSFMRTSPDDPLFKKADSEIRRISSL